MFKITMMFGSQDPRRANAWQVEVEADTWQQALAKAEADGDGAIAINVWYNGTCVAS